MLDADLILQKDSKGYIRRYLKMPSGKTYRLVKLFNGGGVGKVYLFQGKSNDGAIIKYVVKEYPKPKTPTQKNQQRNIRKNLMTLIKKPVLDEHKRPLACMVPPLEVTSFNHTGTFGYVMDYVDLSDYVSVGNMLRHYPDMKIVCRMAKNICQFFKVLAGTEGYCYKDINEGNIYLNLKNGDVRVIDNDNVGDPEIVTISGTGYYMAPEVQIGLKNPDRQTDRFSLAAYLLRMFTGARPYEGRRAVEYCMKNNKSVYDAAPVIFGTQALFIFDPTNDANSISKYPISVGLTNEQQREKKGWGVRCNMWNHLPSEMQAAFIATFSDGKEMKNVNRRTTPFIWYNLFEKLEKTIITCPACKRRTFGTVDRCFYCDKSINIKSVTCKSCGKKNPSTLKTCWYCEKDLNKAPKQTVRCPHCNAENDTKAQICSNCKQYITVTCQCGVINSGAAKLCSKCGKALFKICPNCKKSVPMTATKCPSCNMDFPKAPKLCSICGRRILPGETKCRCCYSPVTGGNPLLSPRPTIEHKLLMDIMILNAGDKKSASIQHTFPSNAIYRTDHLFPGQNSRPLFELLYSQAKNRYGLRNVTNTAILYKTASGSVKSIDHGKVVLLEPGIQFQFGKGMVLMIENMRRV